MILAGGAGAMMHAAYVMRRAQRDLNRRVARFKERHRARRLHRAHAVLVSTAPDRVGYPCKCLCVACGFFVEGSKNHPEECPACGSVQMVDLAYDSLARCVQELELEDRMHAPRWVRRRVFGGFLLLFGGVLVFLVYHALLVLGDRGAPPWDVWAMITAGVAFGLAPFAWSVIPRIASLWLLRGHQKHAHRWNLPIATAVDGAPERTMDDVEPRPLDGLLTAPISGRDCLAWELRVLFDAPGDARPPEWVLREQGATTLEFDGRQIDEGSLLIDLPAEPVDVDLGDEQRYARVKRFLRQRGLFLSDGDFWFYEARIEPGDRVDVEDYGTVFRVGRDAEAKLDAVTVRATTN